MPCCTSIKYQLCNVIGSLGIRALYPGTNGERERWGFHVQGMQTGCLRAVEEILTNEGRECCLQGTIQREESRNYMEGTEFLHSWPVLKRSLNPVTKHRRKEQGSFGYTHTQGTVAGVFGKKPLFLGNPPERLDSMAGSLMEMILFLANRKGSVEALSSGTNHKQRGWGFHEGDKSKGSRED